KAIRDMCVFSSHSVVRDPPFSRMDLISCRNLLIYLNSELQGHVIPIFHYALKPHGYLFLGTSENLTQHGDLFSSVDKKNRVFQRREGGGAQPPPPTPFCWRRQVRAGAGRREGGGGGVRCVRRSRRACWSAMPPPTSWSPARGMSSTIPEARENIWRRRPAGRAAR